MENCELPFEVNFTDLSTGESPLNYTWDFGDGTPSSSIQSPTHTFTSSGSYIVSLIVQDNWGCVDTLSMDDIPESILIVRPYANLTASPKSGCIPLVVSFFDLSTSVVSSISSLQWDFVCRLIFQIMIRWIYVGPGEIIRTHLIFQHCHLLW
ncbi:PKD domain-containing protein [Candidatus Amoebophilus asiaticus]|nr:PKD domain-containing protein [Candidatus Amoebophilus asiaticus]